MTTATTQKNKAQRIPKLRFSEYAEKKNVSVSILLNKAKRQTIPAFREKGIWEIGNN